MTVAQNEATLSKKRWPGTGSSPKTTGSQSVNLYFIDMAFPTKVFIYDYT